MHSRSLRSGQEFGDSVPDAPVKKGMHIFFTLRLIPSVSTQVGIVILDGPGHAPLYLNVRRQMRTLILLSLTCSFILSMEYVANSSVEKSIPESVTVEVRIENNFEISFCKPIILSDVNNGVVKYRTYSLEKSVMLAGTIDDTLLFLKVNIAKMLDEDQKRNKINGIIEKFKSIGFKRIKATYDRSYLREDVFIDIIAK